MEGIDKYHNELEKVKEFQKRNPTLAHQRRTLGKNGRLADSEMVDEYIGEAINNAGMEFLESIHQDIFNKKTDAEKRQIEEDLKLLMLEAQEEKELSSNEGGRRKPPELTDEYCRKIGRPDWMYWPSGRD